MSETLGFSKFSSRIFIILGYSMISRRRGNPGAVTFKNLMIFRIFGQLWWC